MEQISRLEVRAGGSGKFSGQVPITDRQTHDGARSVLHVTDRFQELGNERVRLGRHTEQYILLLQNT